jgi:hypothetical protein
LTCIAAADAPPEGLARVVLCGEDTAGSLATRLLARTARERIAHFECWLTASLGGQPASLSASRDGVRGLIGLGPGLTPSGDDLLVGALAVLDALDERTAQAVLAQAVIDAEPSLTAPLSGCLLRAAAQGHMGERLHRAVSAVMAGEARAAVAALRTIGHSSGWDMLAGIAVALKIVTQLRSAR